MKDKKYRRGLQGLDNTTQTLDAEYEDHVNSVDDGDDDGFEADDHVAEDDNDSGHTPSTTEVTTTAGVETSTDTSVFSQLLWSSFLKKTKLSRWRAHSKYSK